MGYSVNVVDFEDFEQDVPRGGFEIGGDFEFTDLDKYDGTRCMISKNINDKELSYMAIKFNGNDISGIKPSFSFKYKVSSEYFDKLKIYVDGSLKYTSSGVSPDWQTFTESSLSAGDHLVILEYRKDSSASSGLDSVFVDRLQLTWNGYVV